MPRASVRLRRMGLDGLYHIFRDPPIPEYIGGAEGVAGGVILG
ncbi:MAG: hypothetical protein ACE5KK_05070 [Candidatus Brocadiales bacterium]